jgi:hypothetical protein
MNEKTNPLKRQIIIFTAAILILFIAGISINSKRINSDSELIKNKIQAQILLDSLQIILKKDSSEILTPRKLAMLKVNEKSAYIISESIENRFHLIYVFNSKRNVYEKISLHDYNLKIIDTITYPCITGLSYDDESNLVTGSRLPIKRQIPTIYAKEGDISLYINSQLKIIK